MVESNGGSTLAFLACSKSKRDGVLPAREKYAAPRANLFKKSREYVEKRGVDYVILSGKYGALAPEDEIADYNQSVREREESEWRLDVVNALEERGVDVDAYDELLVLAGSDYYQPLEDDLESADASVSRPLADCGGYGYMLERLSDMIESLDQEPEVATDGGLDRPELLEGVEEESTLKLWTDHSWIGSDPMEIRADVKSVEEAEDLLEIEATIVGADGPRKVADSWLTLFCWHSCGEWDDVKAQYQVVAYEDDDKDRENVCGEVEELLVESGAVASADGGVSKQANLVEDDAGEVQNDLASRPELLEDVEEGAKIFVGVEETERPIVASVIEIRELEDYSDDGRAVEALAEVEEETEVFLEGELLVLWASSDGEAWGDTLDAHREYLEDGEEVEEYVGSVNVLDVLEAEESDAGWSADDVLDKLDVERMTAEILSEHFRGIEGVVEQYEGWGEFLGFDGIHNSDNEEIVEAVEEYLGEDQEDDRDDVEDQLDLDDARARFLGEISELLEAGLSAPKALDLYATREGGYSQKDWSEVRGVSQQAISDNVRKARDALEE